MVAQLTEKFRRKLEQMAQYTEKAQEALVLASEAAEDMGSPVIGTEHILVGLIEEGSGTAAMVLEANEVKLDRLLALVEQLVSSYQNTATKERDGYTPSARHVLENGYKEAVRFHAPLIGTEHILMALLKESDCVAVRLLNTLNINIQKVYIDLLSAMGEDGNAGKEDLAQGRQQRGGQSATPTLDAYSRDLTVLAKEGKLPFIPDGFGKWWGNNPAKKRQDDIDIIGIDGNKGIFCECKFRNELFDISELNDLLDASAIFTKIEEKYYYLFSKSGFTQAVKDLAPQYNLKLVTIDDLFD